MNLKVRYLQPRRNATGPCRWYWVPTGDLKRAGWRLTRLPDAPLDAARAAEEINARLDAWRRGEGSGPAAAIQPAPAGSVAALIDRYKRGRSWPHLAPKTQQGYDYCFRLLVRAMGDVRATAVGLDQVERLLSDIEADTPHKAAAVARVGRLLWGYGVRAGLVRSNPWEHPGITASSRKGRLWTPAMVEALAAAAAADGHPGIAAMVRLNVWLGQRPTDVLQLPRNAIKADGIHVRQSKTSQRLRLPVQLVPALVALIQAELARQAAAGIAATTLFVNDATKRPWTSDTFSHVFARIRDAAARDCPALAGDGDDTRPMRFHWTRHTAAVALWEAGSSVEDIAEVTGWTIGSAAQIIERYVTRRGRRAEAAFLNRLEKETQA